MENQQSIPTNNAIIPAGNFTDNNRHINELQLISTSIPMLSNNFSDNNDDDDFFNTFPPGYRFYPTDAELVTYYLKRKLDNNKLPPNKIHQMNLYDFNPNDIAANYSPTTEENVWYIFTPRDRKYLNGTRPNRAAGDGYWKATGADRQINDKNGVLIGLKKALVFYIGHPPKGEKTQWIMHEYRTPDVKYLTARNDKDMRLDDWVLCTIYNKEKRDNTMFKQRKKARTEYNGSVGDQDINGQDTDGQVLEPSSDNTSIELANNDEVGQDSPRHEPIDDIMGTRVSFDTRYSNNHTSRYSNNHTSLLPQVATNFTTFPNNISRFGNMPLPTARTDNFSRFGNMPLPIASQVSPLSYSPFRYHPKGDEGIGQYHDPTGDTFGQPYFSSFGGGIEQNYDSLGFDGIEQNYDSLGFDSHGEPGGEFNTDQYFVDSNSVVHLPEHKINVVDGEGSRKLTSSSK